MLFAHGTNHSRGVVILINDELHMEIKRPHWSLLNHIIITGKQIIYQNRLKLSLPLLFHVTNKLKYIECIE